jgi:hypothetical protein
MRSTNELQFESAPVSQHRTPSRRRHVFKITKFDWVPSEGFVRKGRAATLTLVATYVLT